MKLKKISKIIIIQIVMDHLKDIHPKRKIKLDNAMIKPFRELFKETYTKYLGIHSYKSIRY